MAPGCLSLNTLLRSFFYIENQPDTISYGIRVASLTNYVDTVAVMPEWLNSLTNSEIGGQFLPLMLYSIGAPFRAAKTKI